MGSILASARHFCFREIYIHDRFLKDVKREAIARFGISARHFNGIRFDLGQAVAIWRGAVAHQISSTSNRIKALRMRISLLSLQAKKAKNPAQREKLRLAVHGKRRHLATIEASLARLKIERTGKPKICFGGRSLLRDGDFAGWRAKRASSILLVGSKTERAGNQSAQWDGATLRVRLPDAIGGGHVLIPDVRFRYGQEELEGALKRGAAITWRLFRDGDVWQVRATIDEVAANVVTDRELGAIGVDLNVDHLAVVSIDRMGNPVERRTLAFPDKLVAKGDGHRASAMIGDSVRELVALALASGRPIAIETLDFARKKAALKELGPTHARRLSGFAYARFAQMLKARCFREGVEVIEVDPAYTSQIGALKYSIGHAMSRHHAAALVIGRRALGMGERFVCMGAGALTGPGRNQSRHVASRWRGAKLRRAPAAFAAGASRRRGRTAHGRPGAIPAGPPAQAGAGTGTGPPQVGGAVAPAAIRG